MESLVSPVETSPLVPYDNYMYSLQTKHGFTLVEILIVIALVGFLSTLGLASYMGTLTSSRDNKRKTDIEQIRQSLELYRSDNGQYPTGTWVTVSSLVSGVLADYLSTAPTDPLGNNGPGYYYRGVGSPTVLSYCICTSMEKEDNETAVPSVCGAAGSQHAQCRLTGKYTYVVTNQ